jgi:hypothetical protein
MPGAGQRFQKGQSGNPSGRLKLDAPITELARAHGPRAIQVLAELMNNPRACARAMAADRILDRAYGRPPQINTTDAEQFRRARDMSDDELARIAAGGSEPAEQLPLDPKKVN